MVNLTVAVTVPMPPVPYATGLTREEIEQAFVTFKPGTLQVIPDPEPYRVAAIDASGLSVAGVVAALRDLADHLDNNDALRLNGELRDVNRPVRGQGNTEPTPVDSPRAMLDERESGQA